MGQYVGLCALHAWHMCEECPVPAFDVERSMACSVTTSPRPARLLQLSVTALISCVTGQQGCLSQRAEAGDRWGGRGGEGGPLVILVVKTL